MIQNKWRLYLIGVGLLTLLGGGLAQAKEPCTEADIRIPQPPEMIEVDLNALRPETGQTALPEWSKIEKLWGFYRKSADQKAPCLLLEGNDTSLRLFVTRETLSEHGGLETAAGYFTPDRAFQFYGASRLKVERSSKDVTRIFALPISGPGVISEVVESSELATFVEDLAQLQLVAVPRIRPHSDTTGSNKSPDCFAISHVSVIPSRVFDDTKREKISGVEMTLDAQRRVLENLTRQTNWLQRIETEQSGCGTADEPGLLGRQITSLNLTIAELIPDVDFVAQSIQFWNEVQARIEQLKAEEEAWKKLLGGPRQP